MILDNIRNYDQYITCNPNLILARQHLLRSDLAVLEDGQYDLGSDKGYGLVRRYVTKPLTDQKFEAHRKYIDIQYIVSGEEYIIYNDATKLQTFSCYEEENDCELFSGNGTAIHLTQGDFVILFPQDAHIPKIAVNAEKPVIKAIVKIPVE